MARASRTRRIRPAAKAKKASEASNALPYDFSFAALTKPQWIERVFVALFSLKLDPSKDSKSKFLIEEDVMAKVEQQFDFDDETATCPTRAPQYVYNALRLLDRNSYVRLLHHRHDDRAEVEITSTFKFLLDDLCKSLETEQQFRDMSNLTYPENRALCQYFRNLIKPKLRRNLTCRELIERIRTLEATLYDQHRLNSVERQPSEGATSSVPSQVSPEADDPDKSMYANDTPQNSNSSQDISLHSEPSVLPQTPIRKSSPVAYPTPDSLPRRATSQALPPRTPIRQLSIGITMPSLEQNTDDEEMDVDLPFTPTPSASRNFTRGISASDSTPDSLTGSSTQRMTLPQALGRIDELTEECQTLKMTIRGLVARLWSWSWQTSKGQNILEARIKDLEQSCQAKAGEVKALKAGRDRLLNEVLASVRDTFEQDDMQLS